MTIKHTMSKSGFNQLINKTNNENMKSSSKTLSVRVPLDVAQTIEKTCKSRGITRNALLNEYISPKKEIDKVVDFTNDNVKLVSASFTFEQEGNCLGSTDEIEKLTISCETDFGIDEMDGGCFFVLKTDTGWSIDSANEITTLLNRVHKSIQK